MEAQEIAATLRVRIDDACTSLMVGGVDHGQADLLDRFSEDAARMGFAGAALAASEVQNAMLGSSAPECDLAKVLSNGLAQIRRAIDEQTDLPGSSGRQDGTVKQGEGRMHFGEDAELVQDFLIEAREHLAKIEDQALALERDPGDMEVIHAIFRTFHTIKGLAGFLNFEAIQRVSHESETLLDLARNGRLKIDVQVIDTVLQAADYLRFDLQRVEEQLSSGTVSEPAEIQSVIGQIQQLIALDPAEQIKVHSADPARNIEQQIVGMRLLEVAATDPSRGESQNAGVAGGEQAAANSGSVEGFTIRVNTAKLDRLLEMVGEMVIAQSLIQNNLLLSGAADDRLHADLAQLGRSTSEVQRTTMSMRMVPIGQLFQRTGRLVRDLSRRAGKQVVLEIEGADTEVDKSIAEQLADPLLHMVRNCIDHGIELPSDRVAAGKPSIAHVRLKAYHQAGHIVVEVGDDGRGLDREKILAKAERNGLVLPAIQLPDADVWQLVFEPGFSTAERVTDVSGRGVGMDVVRRNVQKLRGRIEIRSNAGRGTTFFLKLPLTLAIIEGLVVVVGESRYILPLFVVREMFRPSKGTLSTVNGCHEMALVRSRLLPIVRLHRRFGVAARATDPCDGLLVVAESRGKQFCLLVDDLIGKQEVVIKNLGDTFKDVRGLAGCAILGDGSVGLILDVEGIYCGGER